MKVTTALVFICSVALTAEAVNPKSPFLERRGKGGKKQKEEEVAVFDEEVDVFLAVALAACESMKGKKKRSCEDAAPEEAHLACIAAEEANVETPSTVAPIIDIPLTAFTVEDIVKSLSDALELCRLKADTSTIKGFGENQQCILDADFDAFLEVCSREELPADEEGCVSFAQASRIAGQTATQAVITRVEMTEGGRSNALKNALLACNDDKYSDERTTFSCNTDAFMVYAQLFPICDDIQEKQTCIEAVANKATSSFYEKVFKWCESWDDNLCVRDIITWGSHSINGVFGSMPSSWIVEVAVGNMVTWETRR
jgi:hypothetical protein